MSKKEGKGLKSFNKGFQVPDTYIIIFLVVVVAALLTFLVPKGFYETGSAFCTPSGIESGACRLRKPSAPRSPETTARRRKCPWPGCGVPAWRTWL